MSERKETVYIDIDDDITGIIDKVTSAKGKVVALVLPKRATVMQSIVNMRLLKRSAEGASKSVVLITSETTVLPLAGTVGVYVAKTLQSKPVIPTANDSDLPETKTDEPELEAEEPELDANKPVGELAGTTDEEAIEVDNDAAEAENGDTNLETPKKDKKNKKLKIPNFDSFRKKLFLAGGILLLLLGVWYWAFFIAPTAKITLTTDTTTNAVDMTVVVDPNVKELDEANKVVPGKQQESKKTDTQKVPTTGEKNLGEKASGTASMTTSTNCVTPVSDVPEGTTISNGNNNFITQKKAKFTASGFEGGKCIFTTGDVDVIAQNAGDAYNLSARDYTVAGFGTVTAHGSNMTGGTNKIIKVVSQADVDTAKNKAATQSADALRGEIAAELEKLGYMPIMETFNSGQPVVTTSPNIGDEANEVTVTIVTAHTMLGAQRDSVKKLIEAEAKKKIDTTKQSITDDGLGSAVLQMFERTPEGKVRLNIKTNVVAGPQLNVDDIKKQVAGKRRGEIQQMLNIPGVTDVEVSYSPFWVTKTTSNQQKITIVLEKDESK